MNWLNSTWVWADSTLLRQSQHGPWSTQSDIGSSQLNLTWARWPFFLSPSPVSLTWAYADSAQHVPDLAQPVPVDLTWARANSALHGPTRLDIGLDWLNSTSARTDSTWHRPWQTRLDIGPGRLGSTSICPGRSRLGRTYLARLRPILTQLDIGLDWLGSTLGWVNSAWYRPKWVRLTSVDGELGSTSAKTNLARHGHGPTQPDMGPDRLGSTWAQENSAWHWTNSTRHGPGPNRLAMGPTRLGLTLALTNSTRHRLELTQLDNGLTSA